MSVEKLPAVAYCFVYIVACYAWTPPFSIWVAL